MQETPRTPLDTGREDLQTRPRVTVHFAVTLDGKVSTPGYTPARFTSADDKKRLLQVRSENDAVMVAKGTLVTDRMSLGIPDRALRNERLHRGASEEPLRVIISASGDIRLDLPIFQYPGAPIVLYTTSKIAGPNRTELEAKAAIYETGKEQVDLLHVMSHLFSHYQVRAVVCEGGPTLVRSLAEVDLIDRIVLTVAAKFFGGRLAPTLTGLPGDFLPASRHFKLVNNEIGANEFYLTYEHEACTRRIRL
ncbi:MAG: RibD family protein [Verrucomicrobia bacterium]|nr:RibD family protein [Verrucomicrobiota bacterium]MBV8482701.1 RibD family protein [Verrucomicrobiota bacterium]